MYRSPGVFLIAAQPDRLAELLQLIAENRQRAGIDSIVHERADNLDADDDPEVEHLVIAQSVEEVEAAARLRCGVILSDHQTALAAGAHRPTVGTAVVLLGHSDPKHPARLTDEAAARLDRAHRIAERCPSLRAVILSGHGNPGGNPPEADQYAELWQGERMPLVREVASMTTWQNAAETAKLIQALGGVTRVMVVTSWWHAARAKADMVRALTNPQIEVVARSCYTPWPKRHQLLTELRLAYRRWRGEDHNPIVREAAIPHGPTEEVWDDD